MWIYTRARYPNYKLCTISLKIFISDAHYNSSRPIFLEFLKEIERGDIVCDELIFMGDMFDYLAYEISYSKIFYSEAIELINKIAQKIKIIYFEGNHDYNLQKIFPQVKIIPLQSQPYFYENMLLAHGDCFEKSSYKLFHFIVRNSYILKIINFFDRLFSYKISKNFLLKANKKSICSKADDFFQIVKQKIHLYDIESSEVNFILEGHYHQGDEFDINSIKYINFKSLACDRIYYKYDGEKNILQSIF